MNYLLKNAMLPAAGRFRPVDLSISGGRIVSIAGGLKSFPGALSIDLHNAVIFPGFSDVHVHLREPGFSYKETVRTGTLAAARGGYTQLCCMPNLAPAPDSRENLEALLSIIRRDAVVDVRP